MVIAEQPLPPYPEADTDRGAPVSTTDLLVEAGDDRVWRRRRNFRSPLSLRYVLTRVASSILAVWGVVTLVFFALTLTGNPAQMLIGPDAPPGELERVTRLMGYDRPVIEQYFTFIKNVFTGNFPNSIRYDSSPLQLVFERVPASVVLGLTGLAIGTVVGLAAGWFGAMGKHSITRRVPIAITTVFQSIPTFVLGLLLILLFSVRLRWLPTSGSGGFKYLILPALTLAGFVGSSIARVFRTELLDAMEQDHVRTATAKGLSKRTVQRRHIIGNAMVPTLNVIGLSAGMVLGGAIVTETLFGWPGVGQLAIVSLMNRDYPVILADVFVVAVGFVGVNLLVDLASAALDPRTRR